MTQTDKITRTELRSRYHATGVRRNAIFGARPALMEEIWATGCPIYVDESYYAHYDTFGRLQRDGLLFKYGPYSDMTDWRDCHYYTEYADSEGNKIWILEGGRY